MRYFTKDPKNPLDWAGLELQRIQFLVRELDPKETKTLNKLDSITSGLIYEMMIWMWRNLVPILDKSVYTKELYKREPHEKVNQVQTPQA